MRIPRTGVLTVAALLAATTATMAGCASGPASFRSGLEANPSAVVSVTPTSSVAPTVAAAAAEGRSMESSPAPPAGARGNRGARVGSGGGKRVVRQGGDGKKSPAAPVAGLVVNFANGTNTKPLGRTVIAIGEVSYEPDRHAKSDRGELRPVPVGQVVALVIHPDGRRGNRIAFPVTIDPEGDSQVPRNVVFVSVSDERVRVLGTVSGEPSARTYPRF